MPKKMPWKKIGSFAACLLLAFTFAACSSVPENTDIDAPHEEITLITPEASETSSEITEKENFETTEDITSKKTTSESHYTTTQKISESETAEKTEITPDEPDQTAAVEETSTATAADSLEKTPFAASNESIGTIIDVQTSPVPTATVIPESTTVFEETAPKETTPEKITPPETEAETTVTVTASTTAEPPYTGPSLTGGPYNQRYCTEDETEFAERVFELTNLERAKEGLPAFEKMETLKNVALTRAWELTVEYRADHSRPDGTTCTGAFNENGIIYGGWAENIAAGQDTPEGVVEAWMNSPSHRAAILNKDYTYMGVGYYYIKDDYQSYYHFWTQEFYHY